MLFLASLSSFLVCGRGKGVKRWDGPSSEDSAFHLRDSFARESSQASPPSLVFPLIRLLEPTPQSPAATRLLLVGLPGGRYYPCGFFTMSFSSRRLIDGAKNADAPRVSNFLGANALSNYPLVVSLPSASSTPSARFNWFVTVFEKMQNN